MESLFARNIDKGTVFWECFVSFIFSNPQIYADFFNIDVKESEERIAETPVAAKDTSEPESDTYDSDTF